VLIRQCGIRFNDGEGEIDAGKQTHTHAETTAQRNCNVNITDAHRSAINHAPTNKMHIASTVGAQRPRQHVTCTHPVHQHMQSYDEKSTDDVHAHTTTITPPHPPLNYLKSVGMCAVHQTQLQQQQQRLSKQTKEFNNKHNSTAQHSTIWRNS